MRESIHALTFSAKAGSALLLCCPCFAFVTTWFFSPLPPPPTHLVPQDEMQIHFKLCWRLTCTILFLSSSEMSLFDCLSPSGGSIEVFTISGVSTHTRFFTYWHMYTLTLTLAPTVPRRRQSVNTWAARVLYEYGSVVDGRAVLRRRFEQKRLAAPRVVPGNRLLKPRKSCTKIRIWTAVASF